MTTSRARALLFDMDGTLIDSSPNVERAYRWWAQRHGLPVEPILAVQNGRPHGEVMAQFSQGLDLERESELFTDFEVSDEEGMPLIPGAEKILQVARLGRWAVVTSARRSLVEMRFRMTKLALPEVLVTADLIKRGKPDPECFLLAADMLNVQPSDCVIFEDASAGIEAAQRAGIPAIGVSTSGGLAGANHLIRNFREILIAIEPDGWFSIRPAT